MVNIIGSSLKNWLLLTIGVCYLTIMPSKSLAQHYSMSPMAAAERAAAAAKTGDKQKVDLLTTAVLQTSPLMANLGQAVHDRIAAAAVKYWTDPRSRSLTEESFVGAFNQLGTQLGVPRFTPITLQQLRLYRQLLIPLFPNLVGPTISRGNPTATNALDSCGALFLAAQLLELKLTDPDYQLPADQWVAKIRAVQSRPLGPRSHRTVINRAVPADEIAFRNRYKAPPGGVATAMISAVTTFLDTLGIK